MSSVSSSIIRTGSRISRSVKGMPRFPSDPVHEAEDALVHHTHDEIVLPAEALQRILQQLEVAAVRHRARQHHMEEFPHRPLTDVAHIALQPPELTCDLGE